MNGKAIAFGGAPNLGFSVVGGSPFNPLELVHGTWPKGQEVVIDSSTASKKHLKVGQTIGVQTLGPVEQFRIAGTVKLGGSSGIGGATLAGFDLPTAQRLFNKVGRFDEIALAGKPGVSPEQLLQAGRAGAAAHRPGPHRPGAGGEGREGHRLVHQLPARRSCSRSAASRSSSAAS